MTEKTESEELPFCECGCGKRVKRLGRRFIHGHNLYVDPSPAKGVTSWAKGLTKETHSGIKSRSEKLSRRKPWNKGLTKETDKRLEASSKKMSGRTKENDDGMRRMAKKRTGWTKENHEGTRRGTEKRRGRTKETHAGVKRMSETLKGRTKETHESVRKGAETRTGRTMKTYSGLKRHSEKMKGRTKETHEGNRRQSEKMTGRTKENDEGKRRLSEKMKGRNKENNESIRRMIEKNKKIRGKLASNWQGGISFLPYCEKFSYDFKERVRKYFGRCCYLCGKNEDDNGRKLDVHHVTYQKMACCEKEIRPLFVPLCSKCHGKTSTDRKEWEELFTTSLDFLTHGEYFIHKTDETGDEKV